MDDNEFNSRSLFSSLFVEIPEARLKNAALVETAQF